MLWAINHHIRPSQIPRLRDQLKRAGDVEIETELRDGQTEKMTSVTELEHATLTDGGGKTMTTMTMLTSSESKLNSNVSGRSSG
jgi:hypothetical protein